MTDVFAALALILAIEGLLLAAFPDLMRTIFARMALEPRDALRRAGLIAAIIGAIALLLAR